MKLIHLSTLETVKLGDFVTDFRGATGRISHFVPPHKPGSTGHVSVSIDGPGEREGYNYVGVWGMEWIDREDRR